MAVTTENELQEFLSKKARERWNEANEPYLLSQVHSDLKDEEADYKSITKDEKLKDFVKRTQAEKLYKFVEHPHQRAKVGIVPHEEEFSFAHEQDIDAQGSCDVERGEALFLFLRALSKLPKEDVDAVIIPTRVLVKLSGRK